MSVHAIKKNESRFTKFDERENLCDVVGKDVIKAQAEKIACVMYESYLVQNGNFYSLHPGTQTWADSFPNKNFQFHFDPNAKFRDELTPGSGTGFLVGERLVLTAGHLVFEIVNDHCVKDNGFDKMRAVFDFQMQSANQLAPIKSDRVCKFKEIKAGTYRKGKDEPDWALVELDQHPNGLTPLRIDFLSTISPLPRTTYPVYMLGHPAGKPLKYTQAYVVESKKYWSFYTNFDSIPGNSGSPVFNAMTNKVIGIHVRGPEVNYDTDYVKEWTVVHVITSPGPDNYKEEQRLSVPEVREIISIIDDGYYKNESQAAVKRGDEYYYGRNGVNQDFPLAFEKYSEALVLDRSNEYANFSVGYCLFHGQGVDQRYKKAYEYLEKAPSYPDAQYLLGAGLYEGHGVNNNFEQAVSHFQAVLAKDDHHSNAHYMLGICYAIGSGIKADEKKAFCHIHKAEELGHVKAKYYLGLMYLKGYGTERDEKKSQLLLEKASEAGFGYAGSVTVKVWGVGISFSWAIGGLPTIFN